jgi:hypothetical protein
MQNFNKLLSFFHFFCSLNETEKKLEIIFNKENFNSVRIYLIHTKKGEKKGKKSIFGECKLGSGVSGYQKN